jgi:cation:H+ antiporter
LAGAWQPRKEVLSGVIITLLAAAWLRFNMRAKGLQLQMLLVNGLLYIAYLAWTLTGR